MNAGVAAEDGPSPRLCIIRTWPDFEGYGFNLQAEKGKMGHLIGKVDPDSPAEASGLRNGDHIIEVNDANIQLESHAQVVSRIKAQPGTVRLLAIETEGEEYYRSRGIPITHQMSNVIVGEAEEKYPNSRTSEVPDDEIGEREPYSEMQ